MFLQNFRLVLLEMVHHITWSLGVSTELVVACFMSNDLNQAFIRYDC